VKEAVKQLNLEAEVAKVQDIKAIASSGVLVTPALRVDGKVKASGKLLKVEEIKELITA
jgi:small redox-active disulfide protein 2